MRIGSLEAFGVPPQLLQVWESELSSELLPLQEDAVVHKRVLDGASLLVQAPTSAGKTFIGEMAATRAALAGRKVLYLVPTRALAEDKYAHFCRLYSRLGLRVIACTRDRRTDDDRFSSGDFDLALVIPEKLRALWARTGLSQFLGLAVLDELQTLSEPERGPCLELILAQLRLIPHLQIIGLSACLGTSARLADYLKAGWLESTERPVELRKGVLTGSTFRYLDAQGRWATEELPGLECASAESWSEAAVRVAVHWTRRGEPTLVFVRDRARALHLAAVAAERVEGQARGAEGTAPFAGLEATAVRERLRALMPHGVGFHSADLQFEERREVEGAFRAGALRLIFATPTLALGVNLPARNVIIDPQGWQSEAPGSPPALSPIGRGDYENRAGRAGRLGFGGFGRAILLADSELSARALADRYLQAQLPAPTAALGTLPPMQCVLHLCAAAAASPASLEQVYAGTFTAYLSGQTALPGALQEAAQRCLQRGVLRETPEGGLAPTVKGAVAAAAGVHFDTFGWLSEWATRSLGAPTNLEATLLVALTVEAQECAPWGGGSPLQDHCQALRELACESGERRSLLETLLTTEEREWRVRDRAARQVLALWRWVGPEETAEIESAVRLTASRLTTLGETVAWLVDTLTELGAERGWALADCARLRRHAECVALGAAPEHLPLARLRVFGLGRDHLRALGREGYHTPVAVREAGEARLAALLPGELAVGLLEAVSRRSGGRPERTRTVERAPVVGLPEPAAISAAGAALVLEDDRPDRVLVFGASVPLRPAEFRLLRALAESPGRCVRYQALYDRMWTGDRFVEPGQIYSHRSRLCGKLARALPDRDCRELLATVPRHGLMLNLRREEVLVS